MKTAKNIGTVTALIVPWAIGAVRLIRWAVARGPFNLTCKSLPEGPVALAEAGAA